jgi:ubiquinone biosynthesis protein Coq4
MLTDTFGPRFLDTVNSTEANPVHLLFNQWWSDAPDDVKDQYLRIFLDDPVHAAWYTEGRYADPVDFEALAALAPGTLGRSYHDWIVDNGLTAQIATDYRQFHHRLKASGALDGMPDEMQFAVLRGFQVHDILHVLTGYDASGAGEIALQAFSLAQLQFPYFGMWMATVTAQMTFNNPRTIVGLMDAITDGWQFGRSTVHLMAQPWEEMFAEALDDVRARYGIRPSPLAAQQSAGRTPPASTAA